jgi:long-chain acyl-CoA synthetase
LAETISRLLETACRRWPERIAVHDATGEAIRFSSLFGTVLSFAEEAAERGVREGDLCAVDVSDATAGNILRLALLRLGATVIEGRASGLHRTYGFEVAHEFSDASGDDLPGGLPTQRNIIDRSWIRPPRRYRTAAPGGSVVRATTGTTGTPKLRLLTEKVLAARLLRSSEHRGTPGGPAFIGYRPGSSPALNHFLRAVISGNPVIQPRRGASACLEAMNDLEARVAYLSPYNFGVLLDESSRSGEAPRSLARIVVGGGGLHPRVAARGEAQFGCPVINSYGSNETSSIASVRVVETEGRAGVVGRPYPDMLVAFRSDGDPQKGGEILVRPPDSVRSLEFPGGCMIGDADGWIATGDIGRMTDDGLLQIVGRVHEMLNVGGNKRAPSHFEDIAIGLPGVARVAAFAVPANCGTDVVGLAVVGRDGFDIRQFAHAMHARLGPTYPMQIGEVDELPYNSGGKVDREALKTIFLDARDRGDRKEGENLNEGERNAESAYRH